MWIEPGGGEEAGEEEEGSPSYRRLISVITPLRAAMFGGLFRLSAYLMRPPAARNRYEHAAAAAAVALIIDGEVAGSCGGGGVSNLANQPSRLLVKQSVQPEINLPAGKRRSAAAAAVAVFH